MMCQCMELQFVSIHGHVIDVWYIIGNAKEGEFYD